MRSPSVSTSAITCASGRSGASGRPSSAARGVVEHAAVTLPQLAQVGRPERDARDRRARPAHGQRVGAERRELDARLLGEDRGSRPAPAARRSGRRARSRCRATRRPSPTARYGGGRRAWRPCRPRSRPGRRRRARDRVARAHERAAVAAQLGDRLGQQIAVELEADGGDVARLLVAEQAAGTAQLEVAQGDAVARAELGVVGERREARSRLLRELAAVRIHEVGVRGVLATADATADLVQLGEPEHVGALDDERVDLRDVEPALDDRRRARARRGRRAGTRPSPAPAACRPSGRARRRRAPRARAGGSSRPPRRSSRRGCAGRRPGPRARSRGGSPRPRASRRTR